MPTGNYYLACTTYSSPERNRAALYRKMSPFGAHKARIAHRLAYIMDLRKPTWT